MFSKYPRIKSDVAELFGVSERRLNFLLYGLSREKKQYSVFQIPKKYGGERTIEAPVPALKRVQRRMSDWLYESLPMKSCAYAFCRDKTKGIKGNALQHKKKRWIVNIDLQDFFPSIHFGRVRGMFLSAPFNCTEETATLLSQIACNDGHLAQGAPTSPIISNLVCRRLDNQLLDFAKKNRLTYSRYADDLTFSTNLSEFPSSLGSIDNNTLCLSEELRLIIEEQNGFRINREKIRYASRLNRQDVTGLIVNEKVNVPRRFIKQVRAMLYAWKKFGKKAAAEEHYKKYRPLDISNPEDRFGREVLGKLNYIGHIRGKDDPLYSNLCQKLWALEPNAKLIVRYSKGKYDAVVFCEGQSDPLHLLAALQWFQSKGEFTDLRIICYRYPKDRQMSNSELKKQLDQRSKWRSNEDLEIYLFDRDDPAYLNMEQVDGTPICHAKNIYSMLLPVVPHRKSPKVCIEHFYKNSDLLKRDTEGRRIYLSTEFDADSAYCEAEGVSTTRKKTLRCGYEYILDYGVIDGFERNVALPKMAFAKYVLNQNPPFDIMDFTYFSLIFERFRTIIMDSKK